MTQTFQLRLLLALAALTCLTALIGAQLVSDQADREVAVEGAFGWLNEDMPDKLSLHIHLINFKDSDATVVDVAATNGQVARLCHGASVCADQATAVLAKTAETVLRPSDGAYVTLASAGRPFQDGEIALIELVLASGRRVPVDVRIRKR